jgi:uncharacterized protein YggL (DUF469 family)
MAINWTHNTTTSRDIISSLKENGVNLSDKDIQLIIDKVYDAIIEANKWESNGCDCAQVNCFTCG